MEELSYKTLGEMCIGLLLCLLAFGWSAIFWYAASTLKELTKSVEGLHLSVGKLFERFDNHAEDIKELKSRLNEFDK